ncbi:AlwI family type II restriction endonuclease [Streptococcus hillyeri]|uniref:AlwI family type II restriction endonuclease n=2 Tax=Streptococcus hillyeri TaxID=2282420 RepID=A0A3L9DZH2_9STRE|nr:AlwI family type II restriction endonuclease [Streptococcus hillyeri]RLY05373.1 AlwI family type II restriction endonuclease [Streptococcus hillyeri]
MSNYNYRSFIWSLGTTTFRQSTLPLKLEIGCRALQNVRQKYPTEKWNTLYSEFLKELNSFDIINYAGSLPDKDARAITSFLEQLGLCNSERYLTNVGEKVIELSSKKEIQKNEFLLSDYGNLYFLQLLKKSYSFTSTTSINPFIATVVTIIENEYLTDEEFQFFVMTTTDNNKIFEASQAIKDYRESDNKQKFLFDYIIKLLFSMDNYKELYKDFVVNNSVKDCEIRNLGINMNGSQYEISQEKLYLLLRDCNEGKVSPSLDNITDILSRISSGKKSFWKKLMLGESNQKNKKAIFLEELLKKISSMTGQEFRQWFLYNWHFIKTKSTLDDYLDLNKRVLSMTEM